MNLEYHRNYLKRHGLKNYSLHILFRVMRQVLGFKALRVIVLTMETVDAAYLEEHETLRGEIVRGPDLQQLIDKQAEISEEFVGMAIARGDWCYLFRGTSEIASYGWYAEKPCPTLENVTIHFSSPYVYMFKGFTAHAYRGQRLHAFGMGHALKEAVNRDFKGLVSYIEAENIPSLKSSLRLGYEIVGTCYLFRFFGRNVTLHTPGCKKLGVYFEATRGERNDESPVSPG